MVDSTVFYAGELWEVERRTALFGVPSRSHLPPRLIKRTNRLSLEHQSTEISLDTFFGHGRMLDRCGSGKAFVRGLPIDTDIVNPFNASAVAYVRTLLQALGGCISYEDLSSVPEGAKDAHYLGWVVLRDSVASSIAKVYFPSALHRSQISWLLGGRLMLPAKIEAMALQDFIFTAVESFSRMALLNAERHPNAHGQPSIPEGLYRNELYRAAYKVTGGRGIWLSPEFGTERLSMKTEGVDFFVGESKGWAIEVLREGDQISEHLKRFEPGGAYYSWILRGVIKEYIVVDFHPNDQHPKHDIPGFKIFHVRFDSEFHRFWIKDCGLDLVVGGHLKDVDIEQCYSS